MPIYIVKSWYKKSSGPTYQGIWVPKMWNCYVTGSNFTGNGSLIWTDGTDIYCTSSPSYSLVLDRSTDTWLNKGWSGSPSGFTGSSVWSDGTDIYYTNAAGAYVSYSKVLNKNTSTWSDKTWNGALANTTIYGYSIWHPDNDKTFYSIQGNSYWLNKNTSYWTKFSSSPTNLSGNNIWTDGEHIYHSLYRQYEGSYHYVLTDVDNFTWTSKTWNGYQSFRGSGVWTDGTNIYYSYGTDQYVLDKATSTWSPKTWTGLTNFYGSSVWKDGDHIYYSNNTDQYELT